nr:hypothetical protein [Tanacetum cinerariifolium]
TNNTTLNSTTFKYRVYQLGATNKPAYTLITLNTTRTGGSFSGVTGSTFNVDVLNGLTNGGTYVLDVTYSASATRAGITRNFDDPTGGNFYATFYVTPPPTTPAGGTTVWQSTNTGANGNRWFLTIQGAVLHVYGNIAQLSGGLVGTVTDRPGVADSTQNSTLILAGDNQYITGRLSVPDIIVAGSGVKSVANTLLPTNTISLRPKSVLDGVVVQTASDPSGTLNYQFDTTGNSIINLGTTGLINTAAGSNETI